MQLPEKSPKVAVAAATFYRMSMILDRGSQIVSRGTQVIV